MEGLVKIGPWGGRGGDPRDDIAGAGVAPHRLESVVIRAQGAVDAISFTYAGVDGAPRKAGPWGGSGGRKYKVQFGATEVVKEISGTTGPFGGHACVVLSLTFVTNVRKHGPFGEPTHGTPFSVPVLRELRIPAGCRRCLRPSVRSNNKPSPPVSSGQEAFCYLL